MIDVRVLRTLDDLEGVRPAWQALADAVGAGLFVRPAWCEPWWRHQGKGELHVVVATDGPDLVGLAPFHRRSVGPLRVLRFLGHGLGPISGLLLAPGREPEAARAIWREVLRDRRAFLELLDHRADLPGLDELRAEAGRVVVEDREVCPVIDPGDDVAAYLAGRSKNLRRTLRKGDEALAEAGGPLVMELATPTDEVVDEVARLYAAAERENPRLDVFDARHGPFTRELLAAAERDGRLRLFVGRVDGRAATVDLGFRTGDAVGLWAGRYDPADRAWSPGHLALREIVRLSAAEGASVDLLLGDAQYKRMWATGEYGTSTVTAAASPLVHAAGVRILAATDAIRRRVRGTRARGGAPSPPA